MNMEGKEKMMMSAELLRQINAIKSLKSLKTLLVKYEHFLVAKKYQSVNKLGLRIYTCFHDRA